MGNNGSLGCVSAKYESSNYLETGGNSASQGVNMWTCEDIFLLTSLVDEVSTKVHKISRGQQICREITATSVYM